MVRSRILARLAALSLGLLPAGAALAGETQVAVAANFTAPAREIAAGFRAATGHTARLSFGASGQLFTQIRHGAPYQVLLSADAERPARLEAAGLGLRGTRFTYAFGRLALYSRTPGAATPTALKAGRFQKLAVADPATAPYGAAALQTLRRLGVLEQVRPKLVTGASITQAYQFAATGAADLAFISLSQLTGAPGGSRWIVPASHHAPIAQQAILLQQGEDSAASKAFLAYLKGPAAAAVIRRYGYGPPR